MRLDAVPPALFGFDDDLSCPSRLAFEYLPPPSNVRPLISRGVDVNLPSFEKVYEEDPSRRTILELIISGPADLSDSALPQGALKSRTTIERARMVCGNVFIILGLVSPWV